MTEIEGVKIMVNHPNRSKPLRESNAELLDALENLRAWVGSLAVTGYAGNVPPDAWHQLTKFCDKADAAIAKAKGRS